MIRLLFHHPRQTYSRLTVRSITINRPAPLPLPREQQREFEELLRKAQTPLATSVNDDLGINPDVRPPVAPDFEGNVNPATGEMGGPKREPITRATADPGGDWSFKGRVSDF